MAIGFVRASTVSRSKGGSASAALAYEACEELEGMGGEMYDYRNKSGLESPTQIVGMDCDLQELADRMELSETRKNSTVARRYIVALPHEVSKEERAELAHGFLEHLNKEYGVAGAVSVHEPDRKGDQRNYHAHITISDRAVNEKGEFGSKVRVLADMKTRNVELEKIKGHWEGKCNEVLESQGKEKVREKSLVPGVHQGREATEMMRKGHSYKIESEQWNKICKSLSKEYRVFGRPDETEEERVARLIGDVEEKPKEKENPQSDPVKIRDFHAEYLEQKEREEREFHEQFIKRQKENGHIGGVSNEEARRGNGQGDEESSVSPNGGEPYAQSLQAEEKGSRNAPRGTQESRVRDFSGGTKFIPSQGANGDRSNEGAQRGRKLKSLLQEVEQRDRGLTERSNSHNREREGRGYKDITANSWFGCVQKPST